MKYIKTKRKGFCKYVGQKRKAKESAPPINKKGKLVTTDV